MTFDEAKAATSGTLRVSISQGDWPSGTGWAGCVLTHRPGNAVFGTAVQIYFDQQVGLACVASDALAGPQVTLDGIRLTGRTPSRLRGDFHEYADRRGVEVRYSQQGDPSSSELGLVLRVQRAGDVVLSRPVMVASAWADRCGDTAEGNIPEREWRTF